MAEDVGAPTEYAPGSMAESLAKVYDAAPPEAQPAEQDTSSEVEAPADDDVSPVVEAEASPSDTDDDEIADQSADETDEPAEKSAIDPPRSWSAEAAERWASLDRATQEYVLRREEQAARAIQERSERLAQWKPVEEAIAPLQQRLAAEGVQPAQFINRLVQAHNFLEQDPAKAIQWLAQQYGAQIPSGGQSEQDEFADPQIVALQRELAELKGHLTERQQAEQQQAQRSLAQQIESFASDPKHEHFETVRSHMAGLMQSGAADTLEKAYELAVWANPDTRKAMLEKQEADRARMAEVRAAKAQKAAKAARAPNGTVSAPIGGKSIRETLEAAFDHAAGAH